MLVGVMPDSDSSPDAREITLLNMTIKNKTVSSFSDAKDFFKSTTELSVCHFKTDNSSCSSY